ncbi:MAG: hypothetical protein JXR96_02735 [Deltaproteobacteria bacterium]|nr:hypothetical protein [Deltaproteobacteria bacterium]
MTCRKRCASCASIFEPGHWAAERDRCPACGGLLEEATGQPPLSYERYDSSADIQFDLSGLLTPAQLRETRLLGWTGLALLLSACAARILFVVLGGLSSFWSVPLWFDGIVGLMILLACGLLVYAGRRLWLHRRAMQH